MSKASEIFRNKLAEILNSEKISRSELHRRSGVPRPNFDVYLSGKSVPGLDQAEKIANALGYSLGEFLSGTEAPAAATEHSIRECVRRVSAAALKTSAKKKRVPKEPVKELPIEVQKQMIRDALEKVLVGLPEPDAKKQKG